eukprot:gb/GECH01010633.1/.p1 GENE.gb/GECH01010633.1/~~gb/GECH01010633.1/.p1  ORF type:complete len:145 (+),score=11.74 gb/GECH01010633.1/:1-435(+)
MTRFDHYYSYHSSNSKFLHPAPTVNGLFSRSVKNKTADAPIALFQSNCNSQERNALIKALMNHFKIDSYGKCFHNKDEPETPKPGPERKMKLSSQHKFTIAFENTIDRDYVTEKLYQPLIAGSVPRSSSFWIYFLFFQRLLISN